MGARGGLRGGITGSGGGGFPPFSQDPFDENIENIEEDDSKFTIHLFILILLLFFLS